jgi:hypothetical protein
MNRKLQPGNLILLENGNIGLLIERFDMYERPPGEESNSHPCWSWRIKFNNPVSSIDYGDKYGWAEVNINNGAYGKVFQ